MCDTCKILNEKRQRAKAAGDTEKARVLNVVYCNHWKNNHTAKHNVVAVAPEFIIWPNGVRWVVERREA
jgi:hypothetical protein